MSTNHSSISNQDTFYLLNMFILHTLDIYLMHSVGIIFNTKETAQDSQQKKKKWLKLLNNPWMTLLLRSKLIIKYFYLQLALIPIGANVHFDFPSLISYFLRISLSFQEDQAIYWPHSFYFQILFDRWTLQFTRKYTGSSLYTGMNVVNY